MQASVTCFEDSKYGSSRGLDVPRLVPHAEHRYVLELLSSRVPGPRSSNVSSFFVSNLGNPKTRIPKADLAATDEGAAVWGECQSLPSCSTVRPRLAAVCGSSLDYSYLERSTAAHGTATLLAEIQASLP